MKKILMIQAALLAVCGGFAPLAAQSQAAAIVRELSGTVEVQPAGASEWTAAALGMPLAGDTLISTGFKSGAVLALGNSTLTVQPLTRLSIGEIAEAAGGETISLNLRTGRVRADVNPPPGGKVDFTVRSPTATASVRGTRFEFDTLRLEVYDGAVAFTGVSGHVVYVRQGEASRIDIAGQSVSPYLAAIDDLVPASPVYSTPGQNGVLTPPAAETPMGGLGVDGGWFTPGAGDPSGSLGFGGVGWYGGGGGGTNGKAGIVIGW